MDDKIRINLEQTLNSFNRSVKMSLGNIRNTNDFLRNLEALKREYTRYLEQVIEDAGFRSPTILQYATSQFEVLISKYMMNAQSHGTVVVDEMIELNRKEFEQDLEILESDDMTRQEKSSALLHNTNSKMNSLAYSEDDQRQADQHELRNLEDDLSLLTEDIGSHINRIFSAGLNDRQFSSKIAEIESEVYYLKSYINQRVNSNFIERYGQAMDEHTRGIMVELRAKNEVWNQELGKALEEVQKDKETAKTSPEEKTEDNPFDLSDNHDKKADNPFELSDEYKKKVEAVGKAPVTRKKSAEETYRELMELM